MPPKKKTPRSGVKSPKVRSPKPSQQPRALATSSDSYTALTDVDSASAPASAGPQLPYTRAILLALGLLAAAITLALVAQSNRATPPPPTYNSSSSSTSAPFPAYITSSPPSSSSASSPSSSSPASLSSPVMQGPSPLAANGTVHVVFSSHLDVGFTNLSASVIQRYFDVYFPLAVNLTRSLRNSSTPYLYMTHAYLLSLMFDCPPHMGFTCPPPTLLSDVASAVQAGDITFHAFPFNSELEFYTQHLFEAGLNATFDLADRLHRVGGHPTVISQRDVPGTTIGIVPTMARNGVKAISIGANPGAPPAVVGTISRWVHGDDEVYLLFHGGDYGGIQVSDAVIIPGFDHILLMQWNVDNSGPESSADVVRAVYAQVAKEFPGWTVRASTFDTYVDLVDAAVRAGTVKLPIVTQEMGDTWAYGFGSDPRKSGEWNTLQRLHAECVQRPTCDSDSAQFHNFTRLLLKGGEHTWGGDHKAFLGGGDPTQKSS